jgi:hypothetical protein
MKIKGNEVLRMSEKGFLAIAFRQFDMGMKYKIYRKITYQCEDGTCNNVWEYVNSFGTQGEAEQYLNMCCDAETIR